MHLASKLADQLELSKEDKDLVRIAGLLHDAGHGPFSHVSEAVLGVNHEEITAFVIEKTSIHDKLSEKFDTKEKSPVTWIWIEWTILSGTHTIQELHTE